MKIKPDKLTEAQLATNEAIVREIMADCVKRVVANLGSYMHLVSLLPYANNFDGSPQLAARFDMPYGYKEQNGVITPFYLTFITFKIDKQGLFKMSSRFAPGHDIPGQKFAYALELARPICPVDWAMEQLESIMKHVGVWLDRQHKEVAKAIKLAEQAQADARELAEFKKIRSIEITVIRQVLCTLTQEFKDDWNRLIGGYRDAGRQPDLDELAKLLDSGGFARALLAKYNAKTPD